MRIRNTYPAVLAAVALLILGGGMLLKPQRRPVEPVLSETETVRLQLLAGRQRLQDMTSYFTSVADGAAPSVVRMKETGASGILWDAGGGVVTAPANGGLSPDLPVERAEAPQRPGFPPAVRIAPERLDPGAWVIHLARSSGGKRHLVPGVFGGAVNARCGDFAYRQVETSVPLGPAMSGGGIFDTEGRLLAVIGRCGGRLTAVSVESVETALALARSPAERVLGRYGARFHGVPSEAGVVVSEVRRSSPAAEAGLIPGDRISKLDGEPVESVEQVERRLLAGDAAVLTTLRGRRSRPVTLNRLSAVPAPESLSSGVVLEPPPEGVLVEQVGSGTPAMRAGLRPGDRLLRAGGKPVGSLAAARRALAGPPVYLVVRRGARDLGLLLK